MNEGHFTRHLRRMRRLYAARRQFFIELCDEYLKPWLGLRRSEAGIQLVGLFHGGHDDKLVARAALAVGVNVSPPSIQYRHGTPQRGLVMGFASADGKTSRKAVLRLRQLFRTGLPH
jgi:GntR family transcriptional regulator/MocR family aminotransferase